MNSEERDTAIGKMCNLHISQMWVVTGDAGGTPYPCEEDSARFLLAIVALIRRRVLEGC